MTDEEGYLHFQFPNDIPGDEQGEVTLVARVSDHDEYGTLEAIKTIDWGVPLEVGSGEQERALWASRSNAPLYLIILVNALILGIWGVIAYVIYQLVRIKNLGERKTAASLRS